jgi:bleomycin hydrolase
MIKLTSTLFLLLTLLANTVYSQNENDEFTILKEIKHTPVLDQGRTGTCWSFATTSFLESEIMRMGFPETDLSEMYFVYHNYKNKAFQYLLYHGNNNFGEGSLAHDVMHILDEHGMVTYETLPGNQKNGKYNHREVVAQMKKTAININKLDEGEIDVSDENLYDEILKEQIGKLPKKVKTANGKFSPVEFKNKFNLETSDYIELTSYSHHPFYKPCVLEVPDNWAHALFYNLPIDELMEVMYHALNNGYTIAWDGDTSEELFQHGKGKAEVSKKRKGKVDQKLRQETFYNRTTTDDHLMHLVGLSENADGEKYFYTKNSWGTKSNKIGGYLHMSEDYVRLKTVGILVHKNAIPAHVKQKLQL